MKNKGFIFATSDRTCLSIFLMLLFLFSFVGTVSSKNRLEIKDKITLDISNDKKKEISGYIYDVNNLPIIGANVIESGVPSNGTVTDIDGKFVLNVDENAIISVSYIGYISREINTEGRVVFEIILDEDFK